MARTDGPAPCLAEQHQNANEGSTGRSHVFADRGSAVEQVYEDLDPSVLNPRIQEEVSDPGPTLGDRNGEDSEDEQDDDETVCGQ